MWGVTVVCRNFGICPITGTNYVGGEKRKLDDEQLFARIDHNFSEKDKIFGRYAYNDVVYNVIPGDNPNFTYFVAGRNQNLAQFCHFGSAGHAVLEGPGFKNVDFSLLKNIAFTEKMKLQFRTEIFNIFNTPQLGIPNSGLNAAPAFLPAAASGAFPTQITASRGPGAITSLVAPMRQMQFALKLLF